MKILYLVSLIWGNDEPPLLITGDCTKAVDFAREVAADPKGLAGEEYVSLGKGDEDPICVRVYVLQEDQPSHLGLLESFTVGELSAA